MRKLVTVRTIDAIDDIPGADVIARASIDGWKCVVLKGEFKVGDPCLFFEIDSFIVEKDQRFEFLMKEKILWKGLTGIRIKTREFLKQVAQGLALPLDKFPEVRQLIEGLPRATVRAMDFTEVVGVLKWEAIVPDEIAETVRGAMPSYIPSTGAERVQNLPLLLEEQADQEYEESIKLNGYSMSVFKHHHESGVCDRSWWFKDGVENAYTLTASSQNLLEALAKHPKSMALQGELVGPGIMKNKDKLPEKRFIVFHIWDIEQSRKFNPSERNALIVELRALGADVGTVPINGVFKLSELGTMEDLLERANGPSMNPDVIREGLVYNQINGRSTFKVINNRYLLKNRDA